MKWHGYVVVALLREVTQLRHQHRCQPIFDTLSNMEKLYASLDYSAPDRRFVVVDTNMGLCLQPRRDMECKR